MIMPKNPIPANRWQIAEPTNSTERSMPPHSRKRPIRPQKAKPQKEKSKSRLTRRQKQFLNAISEQSRYRLDHALYTANVKRWLFERWLGDPLFLKALHRRILGLELNHYMFLHYCQPVAADRLLTLMHCNRSDVVQKACANLFHMVKHGRRLEKEYLPDQTPSLDPAPDPCFVTNEIKYSRPDEEFIEKYEHRMLPEIPNPQDYY